MKKFKNLWKNNFVKAFFLSFLLGSLVVIFNIIFGKGIFSLIVDYNTQQVTFQEAINYSLKEGSFLWCWYNDLGSNFIGTFSFYNLFSPFSLIGYLFPARIYPYICPIIMILKFAVAGGGAYLFLKRYVRNQRYAILGGLFYAFSGFQLTNILFHFYDSVALFPLLLYTLDNKVYDKKCGQFTLSLFLLAITNWFMFCGEVVFVIIYYVVKVIMKDYKFNVKSFFSILLEGIVGTLMASFVLIPSFFFTISNPRINGNWGLISSLKYYNFTYYFEIIRGLFFPSEVMYPRGFLMESNYASVEAYLPFVGSVLAVSYIFKKRKNVFSVLGVILFIFMLIPLLNSSFILFRTNYYARWFYMASLIFSLLSIKCLDEKVDIKSGIVTSLGCLLLLFIGSIFIKVIHKDFVFIYDIRYVVVIIMVMLINLGGVYLIFKKKRDPFKYILIGVFIYTTFWGNYTIYKYKGNSLLLDPSYEAYLNSYKELKFDNLVRANSTNSCLKNQGMIYKNINLNGFNTNISNGSFSFYDSIDYERVISVNLKVEDKSLNDFLSVKYIVTCGNEDVEKYGYVPEWETTNYKIYSNPSYRKMGIIFNEYISESEFLKLSKEEKIKTLGEKIVLNEEDILKYKDLFLDKSDYNVLDFQFGKNGFSSKVNSAKKSLILYTVPYDKGWKATCNGREKEIIRADNGFMAIVVDEGVNDIEFSYYPPGLKTGLVLSGVSFLGYVLYFIMTKRKRRRNEAI